MACLGVGRVSSASSQKSLGRSASSGGEVRAISASVITRSRARSALPRVGRSATLETGLVRFALTAIAPSSRDNPAFEAVRWLLAIGIHEGDFDPIGQSDSDGSLLPVIQPAILPLEDRPTEDQAGKLKIEAAVPEIALALLRVPDKLHSLICRCIYDCQGWLV